jgi:tetratricopeptide (TPR) repeat protein
MKQPNTDHFHQLLEDAYEAGDSDEVLEYAKKILEINPRDELAIFYKGLANCWIGHIPQGLVHIKKAVALNSNVEFIEPVYDILMNWANHAFDVFYHNWNAEPGSDFHCDNKWNRLKYNSHLLSELDRTYGNSTSLLIDVVNFAIGLMPERTEGHSLIIDKLSPVSNFNWNSVINDHKNSLLALQRKNSKQGQTAGSTTNDNINNLTIKSNMHPEIENLINIALADGTVTPKEREIIFRKAEQLNLDLDEVEMVLEGRISMLKSSSKNTSTNKAGDLIKCPSCGSQTDSFSTKCADCGHEFRGMKASSTIKELANKLELIEKEIQKTDVTDDFQQERLFEMIRQKKSDIIRNFPFPNSREEILELLHFIYPKVNDAKSSDRNYSDWKTRYMEVIGRAKFAYRNDPKMLEELSYFESIKKRSLMSYYFAMTPEQKSKVHLAVIAVLLFLFIGIMAALE